MPTTAELPAAPAPAGKVLRFNRTERAVHWVHGAAFVVALASGFSLYLAPLETLIGHRFIVRVVHIASGMIFVVVPFAIAVAANWGAIQSDFREAEWWDGDDRRFFTRWLSGDEPRSGRFNGGQKANMMFTLAATAFLGITGVMMWQYFRFDAGLVQNAGSLHDALAFAVLVVWLGHLWYALGNPRTRHSIKGMAGGYVDRSWAAELHPKWLERVDNESAGGEAPEERPATASAAEPYPR
ncbi:MAG: cytochrome b/b6 domain-containing protein [Chloroflexota bacterium]